MESASFVPAAAIPVHRNPDAPLMSDAQLMALARMYLMGESFNSMRAYIGFAMEPMYAFLKSKMFVMACNVIKDEVQEYTDSRLGAIQSRIIEQIADRVENGDDVTLSGPDGTPITIKRKLSARSLSSTLDILAKRRDVIEERRREIPEGAGEDSVRKLAEELEAYVKNKRQRENEKVINGESYVDANEG